MSGSTASRSTLSVVIPTFNRAHVLRRAIESALAQVKDYDEVIVVDDGSTDDTREVVIGVGDPRVRYVYQRNRGAGAARNLGTREATKQLVAYLDSDDEWLPGKLDMQVAFMAARPDVLFCFTDFIREYGGSRHMKSIRYWHTDPRSWDVIMGRPPQPFSSFAALPAGTPDFPVYIGDIYHGQLQTNYILTSSILIRRVEAGDAIHFTEAVRIYEDWECFSRLGRRGPAAFLDVETAIQFAHPGPRISGADALSKAECRMVLLDNVWGADQEFLAKHGEEYRELYHQQQIERVRALLGEGRVRDARSYIDEIESVPTSYTLLSRLPQFVIATLITARRNAMKLLPSSKQVTHLEPV